MSNTPEYQKTRRAEHRAKGLCIYCSAKALSYSTRCAKHYGAGLSATDGEARNRYRGLKEKAKAKAARKRLEKLAQVAMRLLKP